MAHQRLLFAAVLTVLTAGCASGGGPDPATDAPMDPADRPEAAVAPAADAGIFTAGQAERGSEVYADVCLDCHTRVEFTESTFLFAWEGASVARLLSYVMESMPDDAPGSLPERSYLDVTAYILQLNGWDAGPVELENDLEALREVTFEARGASTP